MAKLWQIAWHEYTRHVFRRRFVFALVSLPTFVVITILITFLAVRAERTNLPVGYVDTSGLLQTPLPTPFVPFGDETLAASALHGGEIAGYYVLEADYPQTNQARLIANKPLSASIQGQLAGELRLRLLANQPPEIVERLLNGNSLMVRSADGSRQFSVGDWPNLLIPIALLFVFMLAIFSTSGYLMMAVTEEKENRTMEIVLTSVSPTQLMSGKIAGSIAVGMTQLIVWIGVILALVWFGITWFGFQGVIHLSGEVIALAVVSMFLAFIIVAAMMAAVGAVVTEATEGQQITGPFSLPFIIPYLFFMQIITHPDSPLAVALTLIPFTAPVTLTLRATLIPVPAWQVSLSLGLLLLTAILSLWLAGRIFRLGMLQYGRHLSLRQILWHPRPAGWLARRGQGTRHE